MKYNTRIACPPRSAFLSIIIPCYLLTHIITRNKITLFLLFVQRPRHTKHDPSQLFAVDVLRMNPILAHT